MSSSQTGQDPDAVREYWTPERMSQALPREVSPETRDRPRTESGQEPDGD
ncbi:hypothetical protein V1639_01095 [Pseudarthrobacter sp. J75]|nr:MULTISPECIES: hypothetical protein [unclassified Pseudarthrobacter]MEE2524547.1 hypothetical protein [Pseudarthrobacter sp. J47]MEE2527624.1 hypothetical protein [Pseudarthrobacter sp. J75]MEE2570725.1 hypothetical protein [Pseudarthrobacter sp. J64]